MGKIMFEGRPLPPFPVEIVVYPECTYYRYEFGVKSIAEEYRRPVLSRRRRKQLAAQRRKPRRLR